MRVMKPKVQASGWVDLLEMALMKTIAEKAIAQTPVGNGTLQSGVIKAIGGVFAKSLTGNKHVNLFGNAFIIDAVEDVANALLGQVLSGREVGGRW